MRTIIVIIVISNLFSILAFSGNPTKSVVVFDFYEQGGVGPELKNIVVNSFNRWLMAAGQFKFLNEKEIKRGLEKKKILISKELTREQIESIYKLFSPDYIITGEIISESSYFIIRAKMIEAGSGRTKIEEITKLESADSTAIDPVIEKFAYKFSFFDLAYFNITTNPKGAQILIDGAQSGESPLIASVPANKYHLISVSLGNYHTLSQNEFATIGETRKIHVNMIPEEQVYEILKRKRVVSASIFWTGTVLLGTGSALLSAGIFGAKKDVPLTEEDEDGNEVVVTDDNGDIVTKEVPDRFTNVLNMIGMPTFFMGLGAMVYGAIAWQKNYSKCKAFERSIEATKNTSYYFDGKTHYVAYTLEF